jgi:LmbE family N-acetylglucosaminyl deacetylase
MTITVDISFPARVLAIGAHPDDIEFGCGATLAKWSAAGAVVNLCVCTDGSKGTWDAQADLTKLVAQREDEQRDAAAAMGATSVEMLGFVDGELTDSHAGHAQVCRVIRTTKPDVVLTHDPWRPYRVHPDHRAAGLLTIGGIVAARDPHFFPEQGLAPHRPHTLLCFEAAAPDHVENVEGFVDRKVEALLAHRSQWLSTMGIDGDAQSQLNAFAAQQHADARAHGIRAGLRQAEAFARLTDL